MIYQIFFEAADKLLTVVHDGRWELISVELQNGETVYVSNELHSGSIRIYSTTNGLKNYCDYYASVMYDFSNNSKEDPTLVDTVICAEFTSVEFSSYLEISEEWRNIFISNVIDIREYIASDKPVPVPYVKKSARKLKELDDVEEIGKMVQVMEALHYFIPRESEAGKLEHGEPKDGCYPMLCVVCKANGFELKLKDIPMKLPLKYPTPELSAIDFTPLKDKKKAGSLYVRLLHRFMFQEDEVDAYSPTFLVGVSEGFETVFHVDVKDMYDDATNIATMLANQLNAMECCPQQFITNDDTTVHLLQDFCEKSGILLEQTKCDGSDMKDYLLSLMYEE